MRLIAFVSGLLLLLPFLSEMGVAQEPQRYALLVAVTEYNHAEMNKPQPLQYPEIDARDVGKFLEEHGYEVEYLLAEQATKKAIEAKLSQLNTKGNQTGVVLLGFWGHGVENEETKESMFCPFDTTIRFAKDGNGKPLYDDNGKKQLEPDPNSLVGMATVLDGLRICGAGNRILLADCCRNSPNRARGRAFGSNVKVSDLPQNTAAIFACQSQQVAFEHRDWGHGAMTKGLLDLLPEMAASNETVVTDLLAPLRRDVASLVKQASQGRDTQTIAPIFNGLPDFRFSSARPTTFKNSIGMTLKLIPAGSFMMGSEEGYGDEKPVHRVQITKPFYMQTTEVTQRQWTAVMGTAPWKGEVYVKEGANFPATYVSWDDAVAFCEKLSQREGRTYRLPTEAEWEYACRAETSTTFSFGDADSRLGDYAWWGGFIIGDGNCKNEQYAHEVGQKRANPWGLYDLHGNVSEWCSDWYGEDYYAASPAADPQGPLSGSSRVLRGGSWSNFPGYIRSANRYYLTPDNRYFIGFRVVCD